jgi:hypothetical protein
MEKPTKRQIIVKVPVKYLQATDREKFLKEKEQKKNKELVICGLARC